MIIKLGPVLLLGVPPPEGKELRWCKMWIRVIFSPGWKKKLPPLRGGVLIYYFYVFGGGKIKLAGVWLPLWGEKYTVYFQWYCAGQFPPTIFSTRHLAREFPYKTQQPPPAQKDVAVRRSSDPLLAVLLFLKGPI